jgi:hypothetical protein
VWGWLSWLVSWLVSPGDGPIDPSRRVMNSIFVCVYIFMLNLVLNSMKHGCTKRIKIKNLILGKFGLIFEI